MRFFVDITVLLQLYMDAKVVSYVDDTAVLMKVAPWSDVKIKTSKVMTKIID